MFLAYCTCFSWSFFIVKVCVLITGHPVWLLKLFQACIRINTEHPYISKEATQQQKELASLLTIICCFSVCST